jgi:CRP/FNR family transcriptional regulator, cyclic AMP receptor protein
MRRVLYMLGQLSDENIEWLIASGQRVQIAPGQVLIQEGQASDAVYIVLDGTLGVYIKSGAQDALIAERGAGDILGEMSFIDDRPPTATIKGFTEAVMFAIKKATLAAHLETDRDFAARFYKGIAVSLSYRLLEAMQQTRADAGDGDMEDDDEELDANMLDNVYLAGMRFDRIVRRMMGQ